MPCAMCWSNLNPPITIRGKMRIVFHIGVHKTASTLIQRTLAMNAAGLRERGVFYVNTEMPFVITRQKHALRKLQTPWRNNPPEDALEKLNTKILRKAEAAGAHTVLMSEENRIGHPLYTELKLHGRGRFYPNAKACLMHILHGFPEDRIELFMLTRRQSSLLPSLYSQAMRTLSTDLDINGFCASVDWERFRFDALAERITTAFPELTLRMRPYEAIEPDAALFLRDILRVMGVRPAGFRCPAKKVNSSPSAGQLDALRVLAARRIAQQEPERALRTKARKIISSNARDKTRLTLPDWAAQKCAALEEDDVFEMNEGENWRELARVAQRRDAQSERPDALAVTNQLCGST